MSRARVLCLCYVHVQIRSRDTRTMLRFHLSFLSYFFRIVLRVIENVCILFIVRVDLSQQQELFK